MELLYIWIEGYKNIKRQGFNFSAQYRFEFEPSFDENDTEKKTVTGGTLKELPANPNYIENFFGKNITNVTAIVGENGSGKSSVLNLIKDNLATEVKTDFSDDLIGFIIYVNEGIFFKKYLGDFFPIDGSLDIQKYEEKFIEDLSIFFYSNFYENEYFDSNYENLYDISTKYLLKNAIHDRGAYASNALYAWDFVFQCFKDNEMKKQLEFVLSDNKYILPFKYPQHLFFFIDYYKPMSSTYESDVIKINRSIMNFIGSFGYNYKTERYDVVESFIHTLYEIIIRSFISYNIDRQPDNNKKKELENKILSVINSINQESKHEKFIDFIQKANYIFEVKILFGHELSNFITDLSMFLSKYSSQKDNYIKGVINNAGVLLIIDEVENEIKSLLKKYFDLDLFAPFFRFDWGDISYGEYTLMTLFSRFYNIAKRFNKYLNNNLLILIDEGELGMHPQWQKKYLHNILTVLPQIFEGKNLQFILTSHSPFLVSDLPKDHIIFLEKGEDGSCRVKNSLNEMKQTFGANIHTLLTDSFFMTGGLMGEFAKEKIQHLINYINRENLDKCEIKTDEQAQQYLNIIGEPIIKNFLQKQLDSRRLERVEKDHDARIKYLEEELERLRNNKQA